MVIQIGRNAVALEVEPFLSRMRSSVAVGSSEVATKHQCVGQVACIPGGILKAFIDLVVIWSLHRRVVISTLSFLNGGALEFNDPFLYLHMQDYDFVICSQRSSIGNFRFYASESSSIESSPTPQTLVGSLLLHLGVCALLCILYKWHDSRLQPCITTDTILTTLMED